VEERGGRGVWWSCWCWVLIVVLVLVLVLFATAMAKFDPRVVVFVVPRPSCRSLSPFSPSLRSPPPRLVPSRPHDPNSSPRWVAFQLRNLRSPFRGHREVREHPLASTGIHWHPSQVMNREQGVRRRTVWIWLSQEPAFLPPVRCGLRYPVASRLYPGSHLPYSTSRLACPLARSPPIASSAFALGPN
jgi:hypothetical protein